LQILTTPTFQVNLFALLAACLETSGVNDGGHTADCSLLAVFAALSSTLLSLGLATTRCRCGPDFRVYWSRCLAERLLGPPQTSLGRAQLAISA